MASIRKEFSIAAPAATVWDAVRDVGALHTRLVPGFVTNTVLEEGARTVTFANGMVARELIVDLDESARRFVWAVVGGRLQHHNASVQIFDDGPAACRVVWIADLLPHAMRDPIAALIDQGAVAMRRAFSPF